MDIIAFDRWNPSADDPRKLVYAGQRTGQEVFEELKHRLEGQGYLPDEYFDLRTEWENGREIPRDADLFCTVDYGASEGVYVDVYLKWYDQEQKKSITSSFIVGKTLGENGNDLDRMFLTASAITSSAQAPYPSPCRRRQGSLIPLRLLSPQSQRAALRGPHASPAQRVAWGKEERRSGRAFRRRRKRASAARDDAGQRPLRLSDYDRAILAIRDGELDTFLDLYPKLLDTHADSLFVEAAGRPGTVGRSMTRFLLEDVERFPVSAYSAACKKAIDINDPQKVAGLLANAADRVDGLPPSFHGEMACYAYLEHRHIAREIIKQCTDEQIAAAPPHLLEQFAGDEDFRTMSTLVEKGISGGPDAWRILHTLTYEGHNSWMAERLLEKRMWIDPSDYSALRACADNGAVAVGKLLLDGGMDFERFRQYYPDSGSEETIRALEEHWNELQGQEQGQEITGPEMGGMNFG